jgi:rhodanese-related sulfurtransferase
MRAKMTEKSASQMVANAKARIESLDVSQAKSLLEDPSVIFVDLRDSSEIAGEGTIPGAIHMPRGSLEFWIDPESAYFKPVFASGRRFVFFCAADLRSALATADAQEMGLKRVSHIAGGFRAWREAGAPVAPTPRPLNEI